MFAGLPIASPGENLVLAIGGLREKSHSPKYNFFTVLNGFFFDKISDREAKIIGETTAQNFGFNRRSNSSVIPVLGGAYIQYIMM